MQAPISPWLAREASTKLEEGGAWMTSRAVPGWRFQLKRLCDWNRAYYTAVARIAATPEALAYIKRVATAKEANTDYQMTPREREIDTYLDVAAFVEGCLVDWNGVTGRDDQPIPCTRANAIEVLTHFRNIFVEANKFARDESNYRFDLFAASQETARGN